MKKHLKIRALGLTAVALSAAIPTPVLASGFYLPWWGETMFFLLATSAGWVCAALLLVAMVALIVFAAKRWSDGESP